MRSFALTVPGDPIPKGRPRVYGNGKSRHGVTPERTMNAEHRIRAAFLSKYRDTEPITGDVYISLDFWMPDRAGKDWDNLAKLATDALNGVAYTDDRQIMLAIVHKALPDKRVPGKRGMRNRKAGDPLTHNGKEYRPHTHITITEINEKEQQQ
jgi:crossover junction endodeoxyribonuclease RusA